MRLDFPIVLTTEYRDYVWGGKRLRPGNAATAEAWVVFEGNHINAGPLAGVSLHQAAAQYEAELLGWRVQQEWSARFPLLIKLLDCADWLSLQVHPDDEQAHWLEGPQALGKTEVWHVLEATNSQAKVIAGLQPGITMQDLEASIRDGKIETLAQYLTLRTGDTLYMPPGTLHALGPGLLMYEVQQASDFTYRVYDWGRPETEKRQLHIDKSLQVLRAETVIQPVALPAIGDGELRQLVSCHYFTLQMLAAQTHKLLLDTQGMSFHALTVVEGAAQVACTGGQVNLGKLETVLVPAGAGKYEVSALGTGCRILRALVI